MNSNWPPGVLPRDLEPPSKGQCCPHEIDIISDYVHWCRRCGAYRITKAGIKWTSPHNSSSFPQWAWTEAPPNESGAYWYWNGCDDCAPVHVEVFYSGFTGEYFLPSGQYGWTEAQDVKDKGGWWMRLHEPGLPT